MDKGVDNQAIVWVSRDGGEFLTVTLFSVDVKKYNLMRNV